MTAQSRYEQFQGTRKELIDIVEQLMTVAAAIGNATVMITITELRDRVASDTFRVLIAGEFNAGKSTTVNAMLGDKVLPARGTPTTAVLSIVRWGEPPRALLYRTDKQSPDGLDPEPFPIEVTDLEHYVTVGASSGGPNEWGLAEIYWSLEFCRQGVEIVDSPGLNDSPDHSRITLDYVNKADAVVFVFSALQALTEAERAVVDHQLKIFSHDNMFCLVNRINQAGDADDVATVTGYLRARMKEYWALGEDRVFFIDASGALKGRQQGQPHRVQASGLPAFEHSLERFLTNDRGRVKIVPPAIQVQEIAAELRAYIDDLFTLLDKDVAELTAEYERQLGPLESLRKDRELISRSIENHLAGTRVQVEEAARRMLVSAAGSCTGWAEGIDRAHKVTFNLFKAKQNAEAATKEIASGLSEQILQYAQEWQEGELADIITARTDDLEAQVGEKFVAFAKSLEEIRAALLNVGATGDQYTPSAFSRGAGFAAGLVFGSAGAFIGAQFGFKAMFRQLLPQLGVAVGLALLGFGPGVLVTAVFGMSAISSIIHMEGLNKKIVASVTTAVSNKLRDEAADIARAIANKVHGEMDKQRLDIDRKLADAIATVHEQVQFALQQRNQKQESNAAVKDQLAHCRQDLADIDRRGSAVIKGWVMG
jgi:tRNA U34 5-carboxymethylaminomethyl modifying GTPase MnmE/TrmE